MKPRIWLANFLECLAARLRSALNLGGWDDTEPTCYLLADGDDPVLRRLTAASAPADEVGPFVTITAHGGAGEGGIKLAIIALAEQLSKLDERKNEVR